MTTLAILGGEPAVRFPPPHVVWPPPAGPEELDALARQRNTDIVIRGRSGPPAELEDAFRAFLGGAVRHAVTFNSGTSAIFAACAALGVKPGVEVVGPALTYHAALSPVFALGGEVRLADIDRATRCIDPASLERSLTEATRVVIVVHQWGHPADMDRISEIARSRGLKLVEDCSHAHGSAYRGRMCGTFGDAAIFSLQAKKAIFGGEGGILVTNDDEVASRALLTRDRLQSDASDELGLRYAATGFGMKLRMSPFNAIVALRSLGKFPALKENRHRCLRYLRSRLEAVDYLEPPHVAADVDMGAWYGFKPLYRPERLLGIPRQRLIEALRAEGLLVGVPPGPCLATLPLYSDSTNPIFRGVRRRTPTLPAEVPQAMFVADHALDFPTFANWETAHPIIDAYVEGLLKVKANARALAAWRP